MSRLELGKHWVSTQHGFAARAATVGSRAVDYRGHGVASFGRVNTVAIEVPSRFGTLPFTAPRLEGAARAAQGRAEARPSRSRPCESSGERIRALDECVAGIEAGPGRSSGRRSLLGTTVVDASTILCGFVTRHSAAAGECARAASHVVSPRTA